MAPPLRSMANLAEDFFELRRRWFDRWIKGLANGIDERPVVPNREAKSSGSENTYPEDLTDIETIRTEIWRDGPAVSFRARVVERDVVVLNNGRMEVATS